MLHKIFVATLLVLAALSVIGTGLSLLPYGTWWMRAFDFPRYQLAALSLLSLLGLAALWWPLHTPSVMWLRVALLATLLCTGAYQVYRMLPYTPLNDPMGEDAKYPDDTSRQASVMVMNVYMDNEEYGTALKLVRSISPDMLFALETDQKWVDHLDELKDLYPHRIAVPLSNTYGMVLYSRLPLHDSKVRYLVQDDIPSIRATVRLHNGEMFTFYGLHPRPPAPQESESSTPRDAELVLVAKEIADLRDHDDALPILVAGDMNDVAWSDTTQLFLKLSGMFDPRIGRGLFNTFHAHIPPLRVPLDHVFHSPDFKLVSMRRLPDVHSDHFPIYVRLGLEHDRDDKEKVLKLEKEDIDKATETIDEANVDMDADAFHEKIEDDTKQQKTRDVLEL